MAVLAAAMLMLSTLQPIDEETVALAAETGVDAAELAGAVATVGASPRVYLEHEGLIARPIASNLVQPRPISSNLALWDRLARCESGGRWNIATGNGYYGGLQFDRSTWLSYGGGAYAPTANLASKSQQIAVAERLRAARGLQPWPVCGRRV